MDSQILHEELLWGIALWRLVTAALLLAPGLFSRRIVRWLVRRFIPARYEQEKDWAADIIRLVPKPLSLVFLVGLWYGVGLVLNLPEVPYNVRHFVLSGLLVAVAVALAATVFRIIDVAAGAAGRKAAQTDTRLDDQLIPLARKALKVALALVVGIGIIDKFGYSVTSLIASLSVGGLALALAAKDTVANLFGSVVVFTDRPFSIGDFVNISGTEGVIEEIGLRVTRVRKLDKSLATIPNQSFTTSTLVNYSDRSQRRIRLKVGLHYSTMPDEIAEFIALVRTTIQKMEAIDNSSVMVHLESLDDSSLGVLVQAFTTTPDFDAFMEAQEAVLMSILRLVEAQGLRIAFPSRTVYLEGGDAAV